MKGKDSGKRPVLLKIIIANFCGIAVALAIEFALLALGFLQESDIPHMLAGAFVYLLVVDIGWYVRGVW